jgi:hypothetical protein
MEKQAAPWRLTNENGHAREPIAKWRGEQEAALEVR